MVKKLYLFEEHLCTLNNIYWHFLPILCCTVFPVQSEESWQEIKLHGAILLGTT